MASQWSPSSEQHQKPLTAEARLSSSSTAAAEQQQQRRRCSAAGTLLLSLFLFFVYVHCSSGDCSGRALASSKAAACCERAAGDTWEALCCCLRGVSPEGCNRRPSLCLFSSLVIPTGCFFFFSFSKQQIAPTNSSSSSSSSWTSGQAPTASVRSLVSQRLDEEKAQIDYILTTAQGCPLDPREDTAKKSHAEAHLAGDDSNYEDVLETVSSRSSSLDIDFQLTQPSSSEKETEKLCSDRRCCTWFDLANWFGYLPLQLPAADFEACFKDVAHGGTGLYEKLVVLGGKTLDIMAEMHFYEMFGVSKDVKLPSDLRADKEAARLLWARKRAERVTSTNSLFLFGRSYLASAQSLPTRQAVAKYVKACVGYCCQTADSENMYTWLPVLIEHILWTQKLTTERLPQDNAILQDLQEFLGYKYENLIPRIRECLEGSPVPQRSDTPTGRELLRLYATDYFTKMSEETGVEPSKRVLWVDEEVEHFLGGPAVPAFACLCMSLAPYAVEVEQGGPLHAATFSSLFESLIAACWIISTEEKVKVWMPSLIQRLRQTQLTLHLARMGDRYMSSSKPLRKPARQPVEPRRFASSNNGMLDSFSLWNVDPLRPALPEGALRAPGEPVYVPLRGPPVSAEAPCCLPLCVGPRPPPPPQPPAGFAGSKRLTLFDAGRNRYEFFPMGFRGPSLNHRRRNKQTSASSASARRRACMHLLLQSVLTAAACLCLFFFAGPCAGPVYKAPCAPRQQPVAVSSKPRVDAAAVPSAAAAAAAAAAGEPRVKIRYVTDEGGAAKSDVEVFIDDVPVHRQSLPPPGGPEGPGPDFRAVLSTPHSRPVVLNFARSGEDGKPTVYLSEGRQQEALAPSPWPLQPVSSQPAFQRPLPASASFSSPSSAGGGPPLEASGCCCAPRPYISQGSLGMHGHSLPPPQPVDIMISPAPAAPHAAARGPHADYEQQQTPPVSCMLGSYLPGCMGGGGRRPAPTTTQVRGS
ncbi:hypothetical protein Efla_007544 [Eimeria flavescens]